MNVKELREVLKDLPDDLRVVIYYDDEYGDCGDVESIFEANCTEDDWGVVECVQFEEDGEFRGLVIRPEFC